MSELLNMDEIYILNNYRKYIDVKEMKKDAIINHLLFSSKIASDNDIVGTMNILIDKIDNLEDDEWNKLVIALPTMFTYDDVDEDDEFLF